MRKLADDWLPQPRILHLWPHDRFAVKHSDRSRMREIARTDLCGGAVGNGRPYRDPAISAALSCDK